MPVERSFWESRTQEIMDSVNCGPRKASKPSHFDAPPTFATAHSVFFTPEPRMSLLFLCDSSRSGAGGTMKKISQRAVNEIASKWRELPPIEKKLSEDEVVNALGKEMVSLQNRGYTYEQSSELLKADGIEIRIEALKNRLQQLKLQKQPKNLFGNLYWFW
jgi:hypothetical protein